jgi:glycosyltransferase involved in cell wall biosynthesis
VRILHLVTNADLGGAPRLVTELANRAVRDGHGCAAASVPVGPFWDHLDPRVERLPLRHLRRKINPYQDLAALLELGTLFRAWKPDIVHLHSSKAGVLGRLSAGHLSKRIVYTIHGFDTILKTYRYFLPLERILATRCGAIVPVSEYDRANLAASGIGGRIEMIRNGASDRLGAKALDAGVAERMRAAGQCGAAVVLSIARLARPKRFDLFVEVARAFTSTEARFFWIGNVEEVDPGGLPPNVEVLGELAEAGDYANLCDLFMLLSDYEGMPMSILEALSCGKPVLASAVGGIGEIIDEACGILVENEAVSIARSLRGLVENRAGRIGMGEAARRRYLEGLSADSMWSRYSELYEDLVHASPGRHEKSHREAGVHA